MRFPPLLLAAALAANAGSALAQDPVGPQTVPAAVILQFRTDLGLDSAQSARLRELTRTQTTAAAKATSAYLRAEADVLDAMRVEDLIVRRTALERRAKLAIDAEIGRLKAEQDAKAVLNPRQFMLYNTLQWQSSSGLPLDRTRGQPWQAIVAPTRFASQLAPTDSGEVRISVSPNYADIYLGNEKMGTGKKYLQLPIGRYELRLHAVGCNEVVRPIEVTKGPALIVIQELNCMK